MAVTTTMDNKIKAVEDQLISILKVAPIRSVEVGDQIPLNRFQIPGVQVVLNNSTESTNIQHGKNKTWILNYDISVFATNMDANNGLINAREYVHIVYDRLQSQREAGKLLGNNVFDVDVSKIQYGVLGLGIEDENTRYLYGGVITTQMLLHEPR